MDPFRRRAEEMGIVLIEDAHLMNDDELLARLKRQQNRFECPFRLNAPANARSAA